MGVSDAVKGEPKREEKPDKKPEGNSQNKPEETTEDNPGKENGDKAKQNSGEKPDKNLDKKPEETPEEAPMQYNIWKDGLMRPLYGKKTNYIPGFQMRFKRQVPATAPAAADPLAGGVQPAVTAPVGTAA